MRTQLFRSTLSFVPLLALVALAANAPAISAQSLTTPPPGAFAASAINEKLDRGDRLADVKFDRMKPDD